MPVHISDGKGGGRIAGIIETRGIKPYVDGKGVTVTSLDQAIEFMRANGAVESVIEEEVQLYRRNQQ